jgi:hypothetical protein
LVQRYGKDGAIDWNLNVKPKDIVEPKAVESSNSEKDVEAKSSTDSKKSQVPTGDAVSKDKLEAEDTTKALKDDPEADIDSDEEAAFLEAGL